MTIWPPTTSQPTTSTGLWRASWRCRFPARFAARLGPEVPLYDWARERGAANPYRAYLDGALDIMRQRHGGIQGYFDDVLNFGPDKRSLLVELLTE